MSPEINLSLTLLALAIEAVVGYPAMLLVAIRHPVVWLGALISWLDRSLNRDALSEGMRRLLGGVALLILLLVTIPPAALAQLALLATLPFAVALSATAILASTFVAQRSLWRHVADVADEIERDGVAGGRRAVAHVVGRNPETLDEAGVVRAAIESLAENFSDAVVAPAVWGALAGLPGIVGYKAVNTADSMIGHRTPRHRAFGWAAARLDDLVNLPASRIAALWLMLAAVFQPGASAAGAWRAVRRDASRHHSPNAGWPEAAMAGALGLRLAGPRVYGDTRVEDHWMGDGRAEASVADLRRALSLYLLACGIQVLVAAALVALIWRV